jgi:hypothetical protein
MKIMNHASVNDEVGGPCNVPVAVLDLKVTTLLAATVGNMSAASGAIARDLCDCFNSCKRCSCPFHQLPECLEQVCK